MSEAIDDALNAVSRTETDCKFGIGQPVWSADRFNHNCYIVIGFSKTLPGSWLIEVVHERDLTGPTYQASEDYFTSGAPATPALHANQKGNIYFTHTGRPLKAIPHFSGGRP